MAGWKLRDIAFAAFRPCALRVGAFFFALKQILLYHFCHIFYRILFS